MKPFHQIKDALEMSNCDLHVYLKVSERTIRRWVSGKIKPSASVMRDLERLLEKRKQP